jgi:hypothetical protein
MNKNSLKLIFSTGCYSRNLQNYRRLSHSNEKLIAILKIFPDYINRWLIEAAAWSFD